MLSLTWLALFYLLFQNRFDKIAVSFKFTKHFPSSHFYLFISLFIKYLAMTWHFLGTVEGT